LPESFRGGCSVGVALASDDLSRAALQNATTIPGKISSGKCFLARYVCCVMRNIDVS
jgi:hypothetical protein